MPSLIVVAKTRSEEVPLEGSVAVIGRDAGVTFELSDFKVSRRHALLVRTAEGFFVKDLGSRNGVFLNQRRVPPREQSRLKNGDVIQLGSTTLVFKDLQGGGSDPGVALATRRIVAEAVSAAAATPPPPSAAAPAEGTAPPALADRPTSPPTPNPPAPTSQPTPSQPAPAHPRPAAEPAPAPAQAARRAAGIPRALPPARPAGGGARRSQPGSAQPASSAPSGGSRPDSQAELLLARALERADRERVFLRNVCLVLVGLLGLTLAWLLVSALREPVPPAAVPAPTAGPAPSAPQAQTADALPSAAERLDRARFAAEVHPVLATRCAACHSFVGRGGDLLLAASHDSGTVDANFAAAARFVRVAPDAEQSPLLLKALPLEEGGQPHGAGVTVLRRADPEWQVLRGWALAQTAPLPAPAPAAATSPDPSPPGTPAPGAPSSGGSNRPPQVTIARTGDAALVGQPLALDASGAQDPEGDPLHFRWVLTRRPEGSGATLTGGDGPRVELVPDLPGPYEVAVVVHDGTDSARASATVHAGLAPTDPGREAALARVVERLTGRRPLAGELQPLLRLERGALVEALLSRPEPYERWWQEELGYLLDGPVRPKGEPWDSMPARLREGRVGVQDVRYALAVGRDWSGRWGGKQAFVGAVLERLLGLDGEAAAKQRAAAERLYDGYQAEFLGQKGSSQADLVRIAVRDEQARRHSLRCAWRRAVGSEPDAAALEAALSAWSKEPQAFFRILTEAACRDLGP